MRNTSVSIVDRAIKRLIKHHVNKEVLKLLRPLHEEQQRLAKKVGEIGKLVAEQEMAYQESGQE